jgi:hypothetical protein
MIDLNGDAYTVLVSGYEFNPAISCEVLTDTFKCKVDTKKVTVENAGTTTVYVDIYDTGDPPKSTFEEFNIAINYILSDEVESDNSQANT